MVSKITMENKKQSVRVTDIAKEQKVQEYLLFLHVKMKAKNPY